MTTMTYRCHMCLNDRPKDCLLRRLSASVYSIPFFTALEQCLFQLRRESRMMPRYCVVEMGFMVACGNTRGFKSAARAGLRVKSISANLENSKGELCSLDH